MDLCLDREMVSNYLSYRMDSGGDARTLRRIQRSLESYWKGNREESEVSSSTLQSWRQDLLSSGLSERTVERYVTDMNALLKWAGLEDLCFRQGHRSELTGQRFGRLVALESVGARSKSDRSILWRCRCDCGKEVLVQGGKLRQGVVVSCGCAKTERLLESNGYVENTCLKSVLSGTVRKDNTSGYPGVYQKRDKWYARIQYKRKIYFLGNYQTFELAVKARQRAEEWVREDAERLLKLMTEGVESEAV